jgi:Asp-tRNA(Asn)/Glu-tRNA(Gln) amidotransferase A subunit family amidase
LLNHNELQTLAMRKSVERPLAWCEALWEGVDLATKRSARKLYDRYDGEKLQLSEPVLNSQQRATCFSVLQAESIWRTHYEWLSQNIDGFGDSIRTRLAWGQSLPLAQQIQATNWLSEWQKALPFWLPKGAVLMLPTTPTTAPHIETLSDSSQHSSASIRESLLGLTAIAGLSGWPQLSCPMAGVGEMNSEIAVHSVSFLAHEHRELDLFDMAERILGV